MRVGLAGYGSAGRAIHAPLLARAGCTVVAVATSNPARVAEVHADLPSARVVDDLDALLAGGDLDLVVLATPSGAHAAHATRVLDAGLPVVVDKPLAVNAAEARAVVEHAERMGLALTVFQNRRYDPPFATLAEVVSGGLVGRPFRLELRWERWRPEPRHRWRERLPATEGGGILLDLHTHLVDMAVGVLGPVEAVFATLAARLSVAEDDAVLVCRHRGGVVSHVSATSLSGAPGPFLRLLGTSGAYLVGAAPDEPGVAHPELADDEAHCGWIYQGDRRQAVPGVAADQADFYRAVRAALRSTEPQPAMPVDPRDAVHTLEIIDAARLSAAQERVVLL